MPVFIIGSRNINYNKYYKLYNSNVKEEKTRDIEEKDLIYFMRGNPKFKIQNAELQGKRIVGTTGSLDKLENNLCYTIIGSINKNGKIWGYLFVDTLGNEFRKSTKETLQMLRGYPISNASIVQGTFIRGINWEIPCIEDQNEVEKEKPVITVLVDVHLFNMKYQAALKEEYKSYLFRDKLRDMDLFIDLSSFDYGVLCPISVIKEFRTELQENYGINSSILDNSKSDIKLLVEAPNKGLKEDLKMFKSIANKINADIEVQLVYLNEQKFIEKFDSSVFHIVRGAHANGLDFAKVMNLKIYSSMTANRNVRGLIAIGTMGLSKTLSTICKELNISYMKGYSKDTTGINYCDVEYMPYPNRYGFIILHFKDKDEIY